MRYVCLLTFILPVTLAAQDGAAIYKERRASCHAAGEGRASKQVSLKAMSGEGDVLAKLRQADFSFLIQPNFLEHHFGPGALQEIRLLVQKGRYR